ATLAAIHLRKRDLRFGGGARQAGGRAQVVACSLVVPEVQVRESAAVQALGVDVGHLLHRRELRAAVGGLLEKLLLASGIVDELGVLIPHPGQVVVEDQRLDLELAQAWVLHGLRRLVLPALEVRAHAVLGLVDLLAGRGQVVLEGGPFGLRLLALALLEQLVEAACALLERLHVRSPGGHARSDDQTDEQADGAGESGVHSDARAKPFAPASLARPRTRTTSPSTTCRSPARITTFSLVCPRASLRTVASEPSSPGTGRPFTKISCDGVIVTMTPFCSCSSAFDCGRSTPSGFIIADVVIMKMISRTRKTSVSGVTLISATMPRRRVPLPDAMRPPAGGDGLEHAPAADAQGRVDAVHARLEVVVADDGDDADGETERRGDERFRDARRDHREAAGAGERDGVKGADDAEDRTEEADDRRRGADGAEPPQVRAGSLDLGEIALGGDSLELGQRDVRFPLDQVAVHAPCRTSAVLAYQLERPLPVSARQR